MELLKLNNNCYINKDTVVSVTGYFIDPETGNKYCTVYMADGTFRNISLSLAKKEFGITFEKKYDKDKKVIFEKDLI